MYQIDTLIRNIKLSENDLEIQKQKIKELNELNYKIFTEMEQSEQLKYAFDNFRFVQDFEDNEFKLSYENLTIILKDYQSSRGDTRYLVRNKLDSKLYFIEFEFNKFNEFNRIICTEYFIWNSFIKKYPFENFSKLQFDVNLTKEFAKHDLLQFQNYFANRIEHNDEQNDEQNKNNLEYLLTNLPSDDTPDSDIYNENSIFSERYFNLFFTIGNKIFQFNGEILSCGQSEGIWL